MDIMTKAKTRMLLNHPFFAILLLKQKFLVDPDTATASVDGKYLRYNKEWFESLDNSEQVFLLAHEVMHLAFLHHLRRGGRDARKWNEACDYAINQILVDAGLKMPPKGLLNPKYKGMNAEQIYDLLPTPVGDNPFGEVLDFPDTQNEAQEAVQQQNRLVEAAKAVEGRAYLPEALKRIVEEILTPTVQWFDTLERLRSERAKEDYSYRRGHRGYLARGIFMPTLENLTYANAVIAIDTSGSIKQEMLNRMMTEVQGVSDIVENKLFVIYVDDMVREVSEFEAYDTIEPLDISLLGGGGTDFIPPFEYVEEHDLRPKLLIYFTDGFCSSFPSEPEYDVIWLCTTNNFNPPFGEVIYF